MLLDAVRSNSFRDPGYDDIEARVAEKLGIPVEALRAVRVGGEQSNANQVSPAGARSVYQVIPSTRRGLRRQYGVDAYTGPENAAMASGLLLRDNHTATGNWLDALRMYHGGPNRNRWGPVNRAYAQRVAPMLAGLDNGVISEAGATIPADQEITDSYDPRYATAEAPMDQSPEPVKVPEAGANLPPIAAATAQRHRGGLLGLLGRIVMPEPDTLWAGALRDGLFNARESQANYRAGQSTSALTQAHLRNTVNAETRTAKLEGANGTYQVAGNNLVHHRPDGTAEIITAPQQPSETERLLQMLFNPATPPEHRAVIERVLRGFQYTPEVIQQQGEQRTRAAIAGAGARGAQSRATQDSRNHGLPPGYVLEGN